MSAAVLTVTLSSMVGALITGVVIGFQAGRRHAREDLADLKSLVKTQREALESQAAAIESQASRDESGESLMATLRTSNKDYSTMIDALLVQRNRFAREAGYEVTPS